VAPLSYFDLIDHVRQSYLVLTDSGGIQEEAPYFKKPVIVLRAETERPEVLHAGFGVLAGTDRNLIVEKVSALLDNEATYQKMITGKNPFGDGHAAERILKIIQQ
jgi:UDP-N-acetylglucosamine 2-epimerase (non-hydrolysing)